MPEQRTAFKLGLTIIAFFVLFVGVLIFISGEMHAGGDTFVVRFPASGLTARLKNGGEVVCGGQLVGTIQSIEMRDETAPDDQKQLYVFVTAKAKSVVGLRQDCSIITDAQLLGGAGTLIIESRGIGPAVDPAKPIEGKLTYGLSPAINMLAAELDPTKPDSLLATIKGQLDPQAAASLIGKIHRSLDDVNAVTRNISRQLDPAEQNVLLAKLHTVLDNVNTATRSLRDQLDPKAEHVMLAKVHTALDALNRALETAGDTLDENRPAIGKTLVHMENTARKLDEQIAERVAKQLDVENAASVIGKLHLAEDQLNKSLADINAITASARNLIVANDDSVDKVITNLLETSEILKGGIRDLSRNPWRLLYKPTDKESRELMVFDAARSFADAATQLDSAILRLQGIVDTRGGELRSDDTELIAIRDELQLIVERFSTAEGALWKQLDLE
ncbi:MAG: hypothetical protein JXA69_11375 [Phycisphaerae bacterium]|nr:hypothetical protein [Phycisphaerae bacterium]